MAKITTHRVILTAMLVDIVDIVTNTFVAIISGSAVMLVEALAGVADCLSMLLLLIGNKRSRKRATKLHPFGHGKEQYFWATLAGFIILMITATISFFGWYAFRHPEAVEYILLTYLVLLIAVATNGYAFLQAARKLLAGRPWRHLFKAFNESWDVASKSALVLDAMGSVSALIGLTSLVLYGLTGRHRLDGIGAMIMAVAMALFAILLLMGVRSLITGQSANKAMEEKVREAVLRGNGVHKVLSIQTMLLGSESLLVNIKVNFHDSLTTPEIEKAITRMKLEVEKALPDQTVQVNIEPDS